MTIVKALPEAMFAEQLREKRKQRGMTQQEVADRVGMDRTTYAKLEEGKRRINLNEAWALADALNFRVTSFVADISPWIECFGRCGRQVRGDFWGRGWCKRCVTRIRRELAINA